MTKFLETVLSLLSKKGVSKNKMLTDLELGKNSFVNWENRGTIPGGNTLNKIAEYFEVSTDYLLGSEVNKKVVIFMNKNISREEILSIAKEKGIKISFLNDLIGGYRGKLTDWKNGKTSLTETELSTITNYLLGKEALELSDQALDVATKFDQLSDDYKNTIIEIINRFYNENN